MTHPRRAMLVAALAALAACREAPRPAPPPPVPPTEDAAPPVRVGPPIAVEPGVELRELTIERELGALAVWIYRPVGAPAGPRPVVLIGAAGSSLMWGMELSPSDRPEHLPWARAGYVVVAYSVDGAVVAQNDEDHVRAAIRRFVRSRAGLDSARAALDAAFATEPDLDPARVLAVGHSSAATLALRVGTAEPRVTATVAFAPVADVDARLATMLPTLDEIVPDARASLHFSSPLTFATSLRARPVFLFFAHDDSILDLAALERLIVAMQPAHPQTKLVSVPTGDHYTSMIEAGIPAAIAWADTVLRHP